MDRIWLANYPPGVPADIDVGQYATIVDMLEESFRRYRTRKAFACMNKTLTYAEVDALSHALAAWLQSRGLPAGARVAIMMPNVLQYPVAIAAVLRAGYTVVNVNPLYTPRELAHQLSDSGATAIIVLENFAATVAAAMPGTAVEHVVVATMGDLLGFAKGALVNFVVRHVKKMVPAYDLPNAMSFNAALSQGRSQTFRKAALQPEDVAFLQYTGGTTGVAKGAMLTHRNVVANTLQSDAWLQPVLTREPKVEQLQIMTALPLYHVFALTACCLLGVRIGALCVLIPNPRDIPGLIGELRKYKVNSFPAVNTLYNALLNHPDFAGLDWSMLKVAVGGGMAVQQAVAERWLAATGCPIIEGYGLSETSPTLTCNRADERRFTGSIGLPLPSTEISIRDEADAELPLGEAGEICARGPQVMAGYWNRPDDTASVMSRDGFFRTGDIGVMNERGEVTIVDRKKDMIVVSGFKVFPNEVEGVVASHPGVLECAVVGVPDVHSGEAVKLFVVRRDPALTREALLQFCAERLTGYKRPRFIEFRDELPKTNVGKILRRALRDEHVGNGMNNSMTLPPPRAIVDFWLAAGPEKWFNKDAGFDAEIRARFLAAQEAAARGELSAWEATPEGAIALLILLDQFSRNLYRGEARTFAADPMARGIADRAIARGDDMALGMPLRQFFYLPFMHSELLADQERSVALYRALGDADLQKFADEHADIIRRFGRFPHRNPVLGRATTPDEQAYLDAGGFAG